jgi:hypothetical protein
MSILAPVNVRLQAVGRDAIDVSHCPHHCFCNVAAVGGRTCVVASSRSQLDICFAQACKHAHVTFHLGRIWAPPVTLCASASCWAWPSLDLTVSAMVDVAHDCEWDVRNRLVPRAHGSSACAQCVLVSKWADDDVCHLSSINCHCTPQRATAYTCTTLEVVPAAPTMHVVVNELTDDHRGHNRGCLFVCSCLSR